MIVITLTLLLILIFKIQMNTMSSDAKNNMGLAICLIVVYGITSNFLYFAYRTYNYYFENVWKVFVNSDMFKENYTVEHYELVRKYTEKEELLKKQTRSRN